MPLLNIQTNISIDSAHRNTLLTKLSAITSKMLNKPETYIMVIIQAESSMIFAESMEPLAYIELKSLGMPEQKTTEFSATICQTLQSELGIDPGRIYIEFSAAERHMWGWNNKTFG